MSYIVVSMADIVEHPLYETLKDKPNAIKAILYSMGMNVNHKHGYESTVCTHRAALTNKVVTCERFVGYERRDSSWLDVKKLLKTYNI